MTAITSVMKTLVKRLPAMEGSAAKVTFGQKQLNFMGKEGKEISKLLSGVNASSVDVAYKANSNYAIAGFRLRDGKKIVGKGAVSIQNPGTENTILKCRASLGENGKILSLNGYANAGVPADSRDIALGFSRKGGNMTYNAEVGKTGAIHVNANEQETIDLLGKAAPNGKELLSKYNKGHWSLQQSMDETFQKLRKLISQGDLRDAKPKAAKVNPFNTKESLKAVAESRVEKVPSQFINEFNGSKVVPEELKKAFKYNEEITKVSKY